MQSKLNEVKQEMLPIVNHLKPMKEEYQQLQQQYEQKKRVYILQCIKLYNISWHNVQLLFLRYTIRPLLICRLN